MKDTTSVHRRMIDLGRVSLSEVYSVSQAALEEGVTPQAIRKQIKLGKRHAWMFSGGYVVLRSRE